MTDHLERLVDELKARLEEQRLQIAALEEANQQSDITQIPQASMNKLPKINR